MTLYELTGEMIDLLNMIEDGDVDEDILLDTMESVEGDINAKMEGYAKVIKNVEASAAAVKAEADRLNERRKVLENNVKRMKKAMLQTMKALNLKKAGGDIFTISVQKNGGKAPLIINWPAEDLPNEFRKVKVEPDTNALRKYAEAGGTEYAVLGEAGEGIRIR